MTTLTEADVEQAALERSVGFQFSRILRLGDEEIGLARLHFI